MTNTSDTVMRPYRFFDRSDIMTVSDHKGEKEMKRDRLVAVVFALLMLFGLAAASEKPEEFVTGA